MSEIIETTRIESPVGRLEIVTRRGRLCALWFADRWRRGPEVVGRRFPGADVIESDDPGGVLSALGRYFAGDVGALDSIGVDVSGTAFQQDVWAALRNVPAGTTVGYGEIARAVGRPAAVRAVGTAVGCNPAGIVIPCHRVVRSDGTLGGYAGGLDRKRALLALEGITVALP